MTPPGLVLASASATRRALLAASGLPFEAVATDLDEGAVKRRARSQDASAEETALRLALLKARSVHRPDAVVLGCDQILVCDDTWYDKPASLAAARAHLTALRGRTHTLATAVVATRDRAEIWRYVTVPSLTMRAFSAGCLDWYLAAEGAALLSSVGAYRLEGLGVHLFEAVQGEHSAILGLPMLPVLGFLRSCGIATE